MLLKNVADLLPHFDFDLLVTIDQLLIEHFHAAVERLAQSADECALFRQRQSRG